jgi:hypothetical protein
MQEALHLRGKKADPKRERTSETAGTQRPGPVPNYFLLPTVPFSRNRNNLV